MSLNFKNVSNEEKLRIAKDIVVAYISSAVKKKGDDQEQTLKPDNVCDLIKKVFKTVDEMLPVQETRVGIH